MITLWPGNIDLNVKAYPSGEPLITERGGGTTKILARPESMLEFFGLLFWADARADRGEPIPHLVLPFVPGARQDRLNKTGDVLFTAKSIAREINLRNFPSVTIVDPHSNVIAGMIDRVKIIDPAEYFWAYGNTWASKYVGVISPDAGAEKRAQSFAKQLQLPLFRGWKTRNVSDGKISGFGLQPIPKGHYLVVDDICDGGGTFLGLADCIAENGSTADLFTTHGLYTQGTEKLLQVYNRLFCTNSTVGEKPGVEIIHVV